MSDLKVVADPGSHEIVITRTFDAPRELVFKAYTDPDAVRQWWGLASSETVIDQLEARPGGRWRFVERDGKGGEDAFHGVYHEVCRLPSGSSTPSSTRACPATCCWRPSSSRTRTARR